MGGHNRRRQKYGIASAKRARSFLYRFKRFAVLLKCECESREEKKSVVLTENEEKNQTSSTHFVIRGSGRRGPFHFFLLSQFKLFMKRCFFFSSAVQGREFL